MLLEITRKDRLYISLSEDELSNIIDIMIKNVISANMFAEEHMYKLPKLYEIVKKESKKLDEIASLFTDILIKYQNEEMPF